MIGGALQIVGETLCEAIDLRAGAASIGSTPLNFLFRYRNADHWIDVFRETYGPSLKAFEALDAGKKDALTADLLTPCSANSMSPKETIWLCRANICKQ